MANKKIPTPEKTIQKQLVSFLKTYYPTLFYLSIRNEGKRSLREGKEAKDMGLRAGASDLYILHKGQSLFLELKNEKGKQSELQKNFETLVTDNGAMYALAYSFESAVKIIQNFLKNNL